MSNVVNKYDGNNIVEEIASVITEIKTNLSIVMKTDKFLKKVDGYDMSEELTTYLKK